MSLRSPGTKPSQSNRLSPSKAYSVAPAPCQDVLRFDPLRYLRRADPRTTPLGGDCYSCPRVPFAFPPGLSAGRIPSRSAPPWPLARIRGRKLLAGILGAFPQSRPDNRLELLPLNLFCRRPKLVRTESFGLCWNFHLAMNRETISVCRVRPVFVALESRPDRSRRNNAARAAFGNPSRVEPTAIGD